MTNLLMVKLMIDDTQKGRTVTGKDPAGRIMRRDVDGGGHMGENEEKVLGRV
jgi:hypothetical protein